METAAEAHKILSVLLNFTWPIVACFVMLLVWSVLIRGGYSSGENLGATLAITGGISMIFLFFFLNIEGGEIIDIMKADIAWGIYVTAIGLGMAAGIVYIVLARARENSDVQSLDTLLEGAGNPPLTSTKYIVGYSVWFAAAVGAVIWLSRIASAG